MLIDFRGTSGTFAGWVLFINGTNQLQIFDQNLKTQSTRVLHPYVWYDLVISRASGTLTYPVNDVAAGTVSGYITSTNASSTGVRLGLRNDGNNAARFDGRVAQVQLIGP